MPVRIGVIGIGVHGLHHVRLLSQMEEAELIGIYDINAGESKKAAREFGTTAFGSLDDLLDRVDCVTVAVPTKAHYEVVSRCFKRGKHVLVEKPIAMSVSEAEAMTAEAAKHGRVLSIGHIERFNSAYRNVIKNIQEDNSQFILKQVQDHNSQFNKVSPVFIESHRLAVFNPRGTDVAVVLDLMIHDIDIVLDMVKRDVLAVNAVGVSVVSDEVDIANARLEFDGGCVANLTASRISQKKMRKIRTFRKNSYVSMDFLKGESEIFTLKSEKKPEALPGTVPQLMEGISYKKYTDDGLNALELELADFIRAVETGSEPLVTGDDGQRALEVAIKVMESMKLSIRRIE